MLRYLLTYSKLPVQVLQEAGHEILICSKNVAKYVRWKNNWSWTLQSDADDESWLSWCETAYIFFGNKKPISLSIGFAIWTLSCLIVTRVSVVKGVDDNLLTLRFRILSFYVYPTRRKKSRHVLEANLYGEMEIAHAHGSAVYSYTEGFLRIFKSKSYA